MKRTIFFIISSVLLTVQVMAQSENKKEILTKNKNEITNHELVNKSIGLIESDTKLLLPDSKEPKGFLDTTAINNLTIRLAPTNYGNRGVYSFSPRMFFYLEREQERYLNLANYNLAYLALGWQLNSKLNVTGGFLVVKQSTNRLPYTIDRTGVRLNLNYAITNQLEFTMRGQYLTGSFINSSTDIMLPQTGVGASMVLNLGGGSQFGAGAEYQYDTKTDKWNYQSGGKLKLNF